MAQEMADDSAQSDDEQCCENPDWVVLPERRFELPGPGARETYGECMNCGATDR